MSKALLDQLPTFRLVLMECDKILATLKDRPTWSIVEELYKSESSSNIHLSTYSQTLCTALQLGLVAIWKEWGLLPSAVIGHSSGEIAAAYAAGYISLHDAMTIAYYRGLYLSRASETSSSSKPRGAMCAVGLGERSAIEVIESFNGRIQLAAVNSPGSCTLSGDEDVINEVVRSLEKQKIFCRKLRVDIGEFFICC